VASSSAQLPTHSTPRRTKGQSCQALVQQQSVVHIWGALREVRPHGPLLLHPHEVRLLGPPKGGGPSRSQRGKRKKWKRPQKAKALPDSIVAAGGPQATRMRAAHGGVIPTAEPTPLPNADWGGGVLLIRPFWAQTDVVRRRKRLDLRFILSAGYVFTHFGLKPDRGLSDASHHGDPKREPMTRS